MPSPPRSKCNHKYNKFRKCTTINLNKSLSPFNPHPSQLCSIITCNPSLNNTTEKFMPPNIFPLQPHQSSKCNINTPKLPFQSWPLNRPQFTDLITILRNLSRPQQRSQCQFPERNKTL